MKTTLLLLAGLLPQLLSAQINWFETGQTWTFCHTQGWTGPTGCDILTVENDTIFEGIPCKKLHASDGAISYAFEGEGKVYLHNGSIFWKIYDFELQAGQTLNTGYFTYRIDSVFTANLGDFTAIPVQKAHIVGNPYKGFSDFYVVKGIGILQQIQSQNQTCTCGGFFPSQLSCEYNAADGLDTYIRSFMRGNSVFQPTENELCFTSSTTSPASNFGVKVEPNPVATTCRLTYAAPDAKGSMRLFNYAGSVLRSWESLPETIDFQEYPPGIYVLAAYRDGCMIWNSKVVRL